MTATSIADRTKAAFDEPIYTAAELSKLGWGHKNTVLQNIREGDVPVVALDGRGTVGVRESDLHLLKKPRHAVVAPAEFDGLAVMAAQVVAAWPRLSAERKAELGRLLSA